MGFGHIPIPLPSTHSHTHKHHSNSSSNHSPSPGHLPHAPTLPTSLDTHDHKHYHNRDPHRNNSSPLTHLPNVNPATYLTKHQHEYNVQHSFRDAKRAASLSSDSHAIPELRSSSPSTNTYPLTNEPTNVSMHPTTSQLQAQAEEEERIRKEQAAQDQAAWEAIVKAREAAARRSTLDENGERPRIEEWQKMSEGSVRTANSRD